VGTTPPARWWGPISAPSVQVSCRCGIAEPSNYNFISRIETDKILHFCTGRNRIGHHRESFWGTQFIWKDRPRAAEAPPLLLRLACKTNGRRGR
jgi:hypothetical protein